MPPTSQAGIQRYQVPLPDTRLGWRMQDLVTLVRLIVKLHFHVLETTNQTRTNEAAGRRGQLPPGRARSWLVSASVPRERREQT